MVGSTTQISGCQDPLDTDSSRAKNMLSNCMSPSPIFHGADPYGPPYDSILSDTKMHNSTRRELTTMSFKYFSSFLATRYASSPRVIGSRCLFQRVVETFYRGYCVAAHIRDEASYLD